ncbi:MAG: ribonuclease H family protein [bacterium]|nr:ribonuclease H family protein [bacterium]
MARNKFYSYYLLSGKHGVVASWAECERLVSGVYGARYKGFGTREEAEEWLRLGARYEVRRVKKLEPGIYFDAGTGRGEGVEISVTDEKGKDLLHKVLSKKELNKFGKHLVGEESTNNYGELLAMKYALAIAMKGINPDAPKGSGLRPERRRIFGDSKLVIDYWSKWKIKKDVAEETHELAREVSELREAFEKGGGKVERVSGDDNPADLGFHR